MTPASFSQTPPVSNFPLPCPNQQHLERNHQTFVIVGSSPRHITASEPQQQTHNGRNDPNNGADWEAAESLASTDQRRDGRRDWGCTDHVTPNSWLSWRTSAGARDLAMLLWTRRQYLNAHPALLRPGPVSYAIVYPTPGCSASYAETTHAQWLPKTPLSTSSSPAPV